MVQIPSVFSPQDTTLIVTTAIIFLASFLVQDAKREAF